MTRSFPSLGRSYDVDVRSLTYSTGPVPPYDVENWERSSPLDDYTAVNGDKVGMSVQTSIVKDGSNALLWDASAATSETSDNQIQSKDNANMEYPTAGSDPIFVYVYFPGTLTTERRFVKIYYGTQSETYDPSGYHIELWPDEGAGSGRFKLEENDSAFASDTSVSYVGGEWLEIELEWLDGGTHTAVLRDAASNQLSSISATPTNNYVEGGVGWEFKTGSGVSTVDGDVYVDYYHVA